SAGERVGLTTALTRVVGDLSFGTARFVELACVIAADPRVLLLDEPTTGLDLVETNRLLGVLRALRNDGMTILIVAHDVRFIMGLCDDVYVLASGSVLSHVEPKAVKG